MSFKKPTSVKVKVGKLDFVSVAKKSGVSGYTTKRFKDKASEALHQAGFNKSDIKGILSGSREMEHSTLKNVFKTLQKAKITSRGGGAVKEFVTKEKNRQLGNVRMHLRERADEVKEEAENETNEISGKKNRKENSSGRTNITSSSMNVAEKIKSISDSKYTPIHLNELSPTKRKSFKNAVAIPEQDAEIKSLLDEAESHDLPID